MAEWNQEELVLLREALLELRGEMVHLEKGARDLLDPIHPRHRPGASNLLHYLAFRRRDLRELQERLARMGLSSLGRAEGWVLANLDHVLRILHHLTGKPFRLEATGGSHPGVLSESRANLERNTRELLGNRSSLRNVSIMVTMPSEAGRDYGFVRDLLERGMECMRINTAHDDPAVWEGMIRHLRRAEQETGKSCKVLMDLAGPKLRTGRLRPGPPVVKWRPLRDEYGRVLKPARVWLTPVEAEEPPPQPAAAALPVPGAWLAGLEVGDVVRLRDTRQRLRSVTICAKWNANRWAESYRTAYVATGTRLRRARRRRPDEEPEPTVQVGSLPPREEPIVLRKGDRLILTRDQQPGRPAVLDAAGGIVDPACLPCSLPEVFAYLRAGQRIFLDDGKIGGRILEAAAERVVVEITQAQANGSKLRADKGINLPDSTLRLPALTHEDVHHLEFVVRHADLVGLSFVHQPDDVANLQARLARLGGEHLGIVLKIETACAFQDLPNILLTAMRSPKVGVMIARGDLAVEVGFERLAELQEEILWVCEAAHLPTIWATQVLENLAKGGFPSRAEITDAAMGERAECVMLNKGPHILEAVEALDGILRRMQEHQHKKRPMLRRLRVADRFGTS